MKHRSGFVSNSSSSSFIIGLGVVPADRFNEFFSKHEEHMVSVCDVIERGHTWCGPSYNSSSDTISVEAFSGHTSYVIRASELLQNDPHAHVIYIDECGEDPEYDEDAEEYNYDSIEEDQDWFDEEQLSLADAIRECEQGSVFVGGGFNG